MKDKKKLILWISLLIVFAIIAIYTLFRILQDPARLTPVENEWVNSSLNKVLNVSVVNDTNVFGVNGKGVYYDFINDFSSKYGLKLNAITYNSLETASGISFGISNSLQSNEVNFYKDHYILVSKTDDFIASLNDIVERKIGVLNSNVAYLRESLNVNPSFKGFDSEEDMLKSFDAGNDINAILVPRMEFMDTILSKGYCIVYHFSNIYRYYNLSLDEQNEISFSSILKKYFQKWKTEGLEKSISNYEFQLFVDSLSIPQTEVDKLQSVSYNYGFLNNSPYEIISGGNFGGIIASYLSKFATFSNIEFRYKRFDDYKKLVSEINNGNIDLYFGYQNFTSGGTDVSSNIHLYYDILYPLSDFSVVSSLKSLKDETVYVSENSLLSSRLSSNNNLKIETYSGEKGLKEVVRKKGILVMDHNLSTYYQNGILKSYSVRYSDVFETSYPFKAHTNETFIKLFTRYLNYLDEHEMQYIGYYNHVITLHDGTLLGTLAKYFLYILVVGLVLFFFIYHSSKKIRLSKKIRRDDKIKFIDQLTSLKNRNYLNDNISKWNKNTIYPQAMIVLDLDRIQDINDTAGYEQGDEQIKAAANILIKTQLDNSDIMRTDGNEYMIYLIGYQQKQVTTYIHKLNKEFKNLPYPYSACIGYSMIVDDIKSIEDAINEAIEDVKKQKKVKKEEM